MAQTPTFTRVESPYSLVSYDLPSLRTSINEAPGYCVLLMQAKDLDEGENAELRYSVHLSANCTHPSIFAPGYPEDTNYPGLEGLDVGGEGTEPIKSFRHSPFRMDERTGKLLLVRRFSSDEVGTYCLGLVVQDQGQPPQKSVQVMSHFVLTETSVFCPRNQGIDVLISKTSSRVGAIWDKLDLANGSLLM